MRDLLTHEQLEAMLERAAEAGARAALERIGLHDEDAAHDVREVRGLLDAWREAKRTVTQTVVRTLTVALLGLLAAGAAFRLWRE